MSLTCFVLLVAAGSSPVDVPNRGEPVPPPERIVSFVGEQLALERIDCFRAIKPSDDLENLDDDGGSGGWAACDDYDHNEPVEFADDLVFARTHGMSAYGVKETFPAEDFEVIGHRGHCLRGENLPALVDRLDSELDEGRGTGFGELDPHATRP